MSLIMGGNIANVERVKIVTKETTPQTFVFQTASSARYDASVSAGTEKEQRVKNAVVGLISTPDLVKGYDITLEDDRLNGQIYALVDGGTFTPAAQSTPASYSGPVAGSEVTRKQFDLYIYTSDRDSDGDVNVYHEWKFPDCKGSPVSGSFTEGDFAKMSYKILSRPGSGTPTMSMTEVDTLPS